MTNIGLLYGTFVSNSSFSAIASNVSAAIVEPKTTNVTFMLSINGTNKLVGILNITVSVEQQWVDRQGIGWVIQNDTWNFLTFFTRHIPVPQPVPMLGNSWIRDKDYPEGIAGRAVSRRQGTFIALEERTQVPADLTLTIRDYSLREESHHGSALAPIQFP